MSLRYVPSGRFVPLITSVIARVFARAPISTVERWASGETTMAELLGSLRDSEMRLKEAGFGAGASPPRARVSPRPSCSAACSGSALTRELAHYRELHGASSRGCGSPPSAARTKADDDASSPGDGDSSAGRGGERPAMRPRGASAFVEMVAWAEERIMEAQEQAGRALHENERLRRMLDGARANEARERKPPTPPRGAEALSGRSAGACGAGGGAETAAAVPAQAGPTPSAAWGEAQATRGPSLWDERYTAASDAFAPPLARATRFGPPRGASEWPHASAPLPADGRFGRPLEGTSAAAEIAAANAERRFSSARARAGGPGGALGPSAERRLLLERIASLELRLAEQARVSLALESQLRQRQAPSAAAGAGRRFGGGAFAAGGGGGPFRCGDAGADTVSAGALQALRLLRLLQERDGEILRMRHERALAPLASAAGASGAEQPACEPSPRTPPKRPPSAAAPASGPSAHLAELRALVARTRVVLPEGGGGGSAGAPELRELCSELRLQLVYVLDMFEAQTAEYEPLRARELAARLRAEAEEEEGGAAAGGSGFMYAAAEPRSPARA